MSTISQLLFSSFNNLRNSLLNPTTKNIVIIRNAKKKASPCTRNRGGNRGRPQHRGWKYQDGTFVTAGTILATQNKTRWHPGLNVGYGRNGTLFAIESGKVIVTCEKVDLDWKRTHIKLNYAGREDQMIYKKHFNVIPEKEHTRFKLVDLV